MNAELRRIRETIDRELGRLMGRLPEPQPDPQVLARIRAAITAEARTLSRRQHWLAAARRIGSLAAAAALVFALSRPLGPAESRIPQMGEPDQMLATWEQAADASRQQVEQLWVADPLASLDATSGYDTPEVPLESLEESFESLERLIGT